MITRFAPSPTGHLHLGHAFSVREVWRAAEGGVVRLRVEDIDQTRCKPGYEASIIEDLTWLGFEWEGAVRRQSEHLGAYAAVIERLEEEGLAYPCFCTRKDIQREAEAAGGAPHGPLGIIYPGTCRRLDAVERRDRRQAGEASVVRLDLAQAMTRVAGPLRWHDRQRGWVEARPEVGGDVVLARKDSPTSYHLSVTHDDALQGVTLITRGEDLLEATHIHRLLQALLGYETPEYNHHPLLVNAQGQRLAKRNRSLTLQSIRAEGHGPERVWEMVDALGRAAPR